MNRRSSHTTGQAERLQFAIAALQAQREGLGDAVVDTAIASMRERLAALCNGDGDGDGESACAQTSPGQPQLRQVSVLFADIAGSTALSRRLSPEELHAVMDGALTRFTAQVQRHRGKVLQYAGDSLLAAFGADGAHEDDAEQAVRAGLAILDDATAPNHLTASQQGPEAFGVRVGICTGGVLLGGGVEGEHSIRGQTVHTAARMEQTAPVGGLRIHHDTWRQVRGLFEMQAQPPLVVKGLDEPVSTWLVRRALPQVQAQRGVDGVRPRLIGREHELGCLHAACHGLGDKGGGPQAGPLRLVLLVGEPGLGKTRLLDEFSHWAAAGPRPARRFEARASERRAGQPYGLLRELFTSALQILDSDSLESARSRWMAAASTALQSAASAAVLGQLLGIDFSNHPEVRGLLGEPRQLRDQGFFHAARWLRDAACADRLTWLLLDDLHWADDGTLDFIEYLQRAHADLPLLIVGLARPTLFERRPAWSEVAAPHQRIDLAPLPVDAGMALAATLLQRLPEAPASLIDLLVEQAEGNPFHMEELVNMFIDQGAIVADTTPWQFQPERLRAERVPGTLIGVLQARLDALSAPQRAALQLAAVIGPVFWDDALRTLDAQAPAELAALQARSLIHAREPSSLEGRCELAFKHHVLHQVSYDSVLKRVKRPAHARVASWLATQPGLAHLDQIAEHHERGDEPAQALQAWQRAAEAAKARYANAPALAHAERALALVPSDDLRSRYALHYLQLRVLELMSARERLARTLDELEQLAELIDDDALRCEVAERRSRHCYDGGDAAQGLVLARRARALAPAGAPELAARACAMVVDCLERLGRRQESAEPAHAGLVLARQAGARPVEAMLLNLVGMSLNDAGDYGAATASYQQALAIHRDAGNRHNEGGTLCNLAYAALSLGDYTTASAQFRQAQALCAQIGQRQSEGIVHINLALVALHQGLGTDAHEHAQQALALLREAGDRWAEAAALRVAGQAALALGDAAAAVTQFEASRELFDALGMGHLAIEAIAALASEALMRSDLAAATAQVEQILARQAAGAGLEGTDEPLRIPLVCFQVLRAAGDPRAQQALAAAHTELSTRAARITDAALRHGFLHGVPHHREIVEAWRRHGAAAS